MSDLLHPNVARQLDGLAVDPDRPTILCDADEVLFAFMVEFERYLHNHGCYYAWRSYALDGNVRRRRGGAALAKTEVSALIQAFFTASTEHLPAVPGAASALSALSRRARIFVLTNLKTEHVAARGRALSRHGLPYPLIANEGAKGPAVGWFAERVAAPLYFIDDSPRHHESVAQRADRAVRIHFVAERRLAGLLGPAEHAHYRTDTWAAAHAVIDADLTARGY